MDWLTLLIRLVEALAWPAAVLIIALVFRPEFRRLVPLVRKLKVAGLEAEFEQSVREISEETGAVTPELGVKPDTRKSTLIELAATHPRAAILEAWRGVEIAVKRAAIQNAGSPVPDVSSPRKAMRELVQTSVMSPEDASLFYDLQGLRNQAAHVPDFEPSQEAAIRYVVLASHLLSRLGRIAEPG